VLLHWHIDFRPFSNDSPLTVGPAIVLLDLALHLLAKSTFNGSLLSEWC